MRYVDHDPVASHAAAAQCRDVAAHYRRVAGWLVTDPRRVRWWGCERDDVVRAAEELSVDLHREAAALLEAAERLELAVRAAQQREEELAAQAAAAAAAPVGHPGPSATPPWLTPSHPTPRPAPRPSTPPWLAAPRATAPVRAGGRLR